jgi:hypothetical protein
VYGLGERSTAGRRGTAQRHPPGRLLDWLKTNFFKTELEFGRCLRLPAEGPCECDLYLTCAKFVTTPEYAPRLRARREIERMLALDAAARGWDCEVERHRRTGERSRSGWPTSAAHQQVR